ncbi:Scr1 family TA system antitoxin-like transcriptional regulator [Streptomyces sp. NPDC055299]
MNQTAVVLLIEEAMLYHQLGDPEVMAPQLENLLTTDALPSLSLGIIPMACKRGQWPREMLYMYDDKLVSVELVSAQVDITQPAEVALYLTAFEQLRCMAVYGAEVRALILKALEGSRRGRV